jgi:hypothetical protein
MPCSATFARCNCSAWAHRLTEGSGTTSATSCFRAELDEAALDALEEADDDGSLRCSGTPDALAEIESTQGWSWVGRASDGIDYRCERRLIEEARRLKSAGKMLAPIIDDAHLMDVSALRKIRLLFEDFPKNHCLVLVAQPELLSKLALTVNEDLKNRVTYSVLLRKLAPDSVADFIRAELDKVALAHTTFTDDALSLIVRSSEGGLRRAKNLCLGANRQPHGARFRGHVQPHGANRLSGSWSHLQGELRWIFSLMEPTDFQGHGAISRRLAG